MAGPGPATLTYPLGQTDLLVASDRPNHNAEWAVDELLTIIGSASREMDDNGRDRAQMLAAALGVAAARVPTDRGTLQDVRRFTEAGVAVRSRARITFDRDWPPDQVAAPAALAVALVQMAVNLETHDLATEIHVTLESGPTFRLPCALPPGAARAHLTNSRWENQAVESRSLQAGSPLEALAMGWRSSSRELSWGPLAMPAGLAPGAARRMVREIVRPENDGHRGRVRRGQGGALLALVLLFAAGGCNATVTSTDGVSPNASVASSPSGSSTDTLTTTSIATTSPRPALPATSTKKPFLWALLADGQSGFIEVSGAPTGSVCSVRAFLKSGHEISGSGLKPKLVTGTDSSRGVSWSDNDAPMLRLPRPAPSPGEDAYWLATCINNAFNPPRGTTRSAFRTP